MTERNDTVSAEARTPDWRPLLPVVVAALVLGLGGSILLPGLDASAIAAFRESSPGGMGRLSVLALGVQPLLSALLIAEALKLVLPPLARRAARSPEATRSAGPPVLALAFLLAALQGVAIHGGLAAVGFVGDDTASMAVLAATSLGGVAVLTALAGWIRVPVLALGGFWTLLSLPLAGSLPATATTLLELARFGVVAPPVLGVALALLLAGVWAIVFVASALVGRVEVAGGVPARWSPILVWPPLLAGAAANLAGGLVAEFDLSEARSPALSFSTVWAITFALALPPIVFLYARSIAVAYPQEPRWEGRRAVLGLVALLQVAISAGLLLASDALATPIRDGTALIPLVVVAWSFWRTLSAPPQSPHA